MKRRIQIIILLGIFLMVSAETVFCERWLSQTVENGRSDNVITAVFEDSSDNMWYGTKQGEISRYDGSWTTFDDNDGLFGGRISDINEDAYGNVWAATSKGIVVFDGTSWIALLKYVNSPGVNLATQIYKDHNGVMWFGTSDGIGSYDGDSLKTYNSESGVPFKGVKAIGQDKSGNMVFGATDGAFFYDGESFSTISQMSGYDVYTIFTDSKGILWFCTATGAVRYDGISWQTFTMADGLTHEYVTSAVEDDEGVLWFGTVGGINTLEGDVWKSYTNEDGHTIIGILDIIIDKSGNLWFAKTGGVFIYDRTWMTLKTEDGLISNSVSNIIEDSAGAVWIGTTEGLSRLDGDDFTHYLTTDGLADIQILSLYEDIDGKIWAGTTKGVSRFNGEAWTTYTTDDGLSHNSVTSISGSDDGTVWFAGKAGVSSFDGEIWQQYTTTDNLPNNSVSSIFVSSNSEVWIGTATGAARFNGTLWETFDDIPALSAYSISSIAEDASGNIWFGLFDGYVVRYGGDDNEVIIPPKTTTPYLVLDITVDSRGDIWIGSNDGYQSYDGERWLSDSSEEGISELYVFSIIEDERGDIWFGTLDGVFVYRVDRTPPETFITKAPEDISGVAQAFFQYDGGDRLSPENQITFSYAFMNGSAQPLESDWSEFSSVNSVLSDPFTNGLYTFYVRSSDDVGNIDRTPASKSFTVDLTAPTVIITSPSNNDIIFGTVAVTGSAFDNSELPDLDLFILEYGRGDDVDNVDEWTEIIQAENLSVYNGTLAEWNTQDIYGQFVLRLKAVDKKEHFSNYVVSVKVVAASNSLEANQGGRIGGLSDNIDLYVPPNAILESARITITPVSEENLTIPDDASLRLFGKSFDIEPIGMQLLKPATLAVSFDGSENSEEFDLSKLAVFQWSPYEKTWERIGGTVDLKSKTLTTVIHKFGRIAVFEGSSDASQTKEIANISCQPRVFSPKGRSLEPFTTLSFDLKKSSYVTVKVYNSAGRLIKTVEDHLFMNNGTNAVKWDGLNSDGEAVVSGLYIFTIENSFGAAETHTVGIVNK
jgi:ligand-binding sensor domain-containing protein